MRTRHQAQHRCEAKEPREARARHGVLLFDLACGSAAIAVIMVGTMVAMAGVKKQQQQNTEYFLAHQYLANVAEAIDALRIPDSKNLDSDIQNDASVSLSDFVSLPETAKQSLPKAELTIAVRPARMSQSAGAGKDFDSSGLQQIQCKITWEPSFPPNNSLPNGATPNKRHVSLQIWKRFNLKSQSANPETSASPGTTEAQTNERALESQG